MPAVMIEVLQRFTWNGEPKELDDFFRLTKNHRLARAVIFTHQIGWELRLHSRLAEGSRVHAGLSHAGGSVQHGEHWKAAMIGKGWS